MHSRNRYTGKKPDFGELAEFRPSLKPFLTQKNDPSAQPFSFSLDFSKPEALRELACALLERDFGIKLEIPLDKLIPTVPLRLNYIHWLEDLLSEANGGDGDPSIPKGASIVGIDIGTGASCVYPLLGAKLNGWQFLATEIDEEAIRFACENVSRNGLSDKITVKQASEETILIGAIDPSVQYNFCMCNPPFFKDNAERYGGHSRSGRRPVAGTFSSGNRHETVTEGGEVGFVMKIVQDSIKLRTGVRWYTSMLGKKTSLRAILDELKKHQVPVVTTTEFVQGKTWRWAIAWSFDETLKHKTSQIAQRPPKRMRPIILQVSGCQPSPEGFQHTKQWLQDQLTELQIEWCVNGEDNEAVHLHCKAHKNTWSHQRKKRRLLQKLKPKEPQAESEEPTLAEEGSVTSSDVGMGTNQPYSKQQTEPKDRGSIMASSSSSLVVANQDTKAQCVGSEKWIVDESEGPSDLPMKCQQQLKELEAMYTPCNVEFQCSILFGSPGEELGAQVGARKSRVSSSGKEDECGSQEQKLMIYLSFEWIEGNGRDLLHQITQYLNNKLKNFCIS